MQYKIIFIHFVDDTVLQQASQNTVDRLLAQHAPILYQQRGYSFPSKNHAGRPEDMFTICVAENQFYFSRAQMVAQMRLEGVPGELWGSVFDCLYMSLGFIHLFDEDDLNIIRVVTNALEYGGVLAELCKILMKNHCWENVNPLEMREALMEAFHVSTTQLRNKHYIDIELTL